MPVKIKFTPGEGILGQLGPRSGDLPTDVSINYVIVDKRDSPTNLPGRNNKAQRGTDK